MEPFGDEWRQTATIALPHYVSSDNSIELESLMPIPRKPEQPIDESEDQDIAAEIEKTNRMFARKGIRLKDETEKLPP